MQVILFGATGMIGQGVLRECLIDAEITRVVSVGRRRAAPPHPKLVEILSNDLSELTGIATELQDLDACFFCLGVSSARMSEDEYRRITYDLTLSTATLLARLNPGMTFIYVSGEGTDSTEKGRSMWARVKGATENALLRLPFRRAYMFRPAFIQPVHGEVSRTKLYRILYRIVSPLVPLLRRAVPNYFTTTEQLAKAMIRVARDGYALPVLGTREINLL